ncbi:MAG: response regulator transcription factor [Synergistales bacterium]|nr:response regulator transcription factor [Synergistales bacterium]
MPGQRILLVEDEEALGDLVAEGLKRHGFLVERAADGDAALDIVELSPPDLVVLDLMLPQMDGWEVCRRIRQQPDTKDLPIIILTARREERDVIAGLELGADDYLKKPFSMAELAARSKALLRRMERKPQESEPVLSEGPLSFDRNARMFQKSGDYIELSPTEYALLELLMRRRGQVVPREDLLMNIWGYYGGDTRTVDVHVSRLRKKVEPDPEHPGLIHTVRGRGYRLKWEQPDEPDQN